MHISTSVIRNREQTIELGKKLQYFTIVWNSIEAVAAIAAGIVAGIRTDLVPPMDCAYTAPFFGWAQRLQGREAEFFEIAFRAYADMAERTNPATYAGQGWNTSLTKVLDNAVVGYCKVHLLDKGSREKALVAKAKGDGHLRRNCGSGRSSASIR